MILTMIVLVFVMLATDVFAQTNDSGPEPQPVKDWLATHPNFTGCVHTDLKTGESKEITCIHPELIPAGLHEPQNNTHVMSPLKQFKAGTFAQGVQCNTGLQLFFKAEDYTPVCAKSGTATVLLKRGWATTHPPDPYVGKIAINGLQQNYAIGQPIGGIMVNYAGYYWYAEPDVKILDVNGTQIWFNCPYCYTRSTPVPHPSLDAFTYIVRDYATNKHPVINKTGTYTMIASLDNKTASAEFTIVKSLPTHHDTAGDIVISYNYTLYENGAFHVTQDENFTLMLNVTSDPSNVPVTLYAAPHSGFTKTNGIDFKLSDTKIITPAKVMRYMSVSKDAIPSTYGESIRLNGTDGMELVTYTYHITVAGLPYQQFTPGAH